MAECSLRVSGKAKLLNHDIIAFGTRLDRYLRPELKAKGICNLFRCAFKRAQPDSPVAQICRDGDAASPGLLKRLREDREISIKCNLGIRVVNRKSSTREYGVPTGDSPGARGVSCRARAGIRATAGIRNGLAATCLLFICHRFTPFVRVRREQYYAGAILFCLAIFFQLSASLKACWRNCAATTSN